MSEIRRIPSKSAKKTCMLFVEHKNGSDCVGAALHNLRYSDGMAQSAVWELHSSGHG